MKFVYPARLWHPSADEIVVSFRDLPECRTSGKDEAEARSEAQDALEEAIAGRMNRIDSIPIPSPRKNGERLIAVPTATASKAALALALRDSGLSHAEFAKLFRTDEESVRRMLDPRHRTSSDRIGRALHVLGRQIALERRELTPA